MSKNILTDTGFWIAYFEERDAHHSDAVAIASVAFSHKIICPFPSLYEFLNTRFARSARKINDYELLLKRLDVEYIYDEEYRIDSIDNYILYNKKSKHISLVDLIINQIIEDVNVKIDYMVTFNKKDFFETCGKRNVEFLS
jgi:predicted nucleic acid-binding protein